MAKRSLGTEWFGYNGNEFTPPKSFGAESDLSWSNAYRAIFYLVGGFNSSKNVDFSEPTDISKASRNFLEYVLVQNILNLEKKLKAIHLSSYEKKTDKLSKIKGKINFQKTATRGLGNAAIFVCDYTELNQNDPFCILLKNGSKLIYQTIGKWLNEENRKALYGATKFIESYFHSTKNSTNLQMLCFQLLSEKLKNSKFQKVYNELKVISYFLLYNQIGYMGADSKSIKINGIMLNLNRVFEKLLCEALTATSCFKKDNERLNEVYLIDNSGSQPSNFRMRPDCRGFVNFENQNFYLLLDAKHKIMSSDLDENNIEDKINRADLYQMVTYVKTMENRKEETEQTIAVLVGLNYEVGDENDLISAVPAIDIRFDNENIEILRISMNFGLAMKKFGSSLRNQQSRSEVLSELGNEMLKAICTANKTVKAG